MGLAAGSVMAGSSRRLRARADDRRVPLTGMLVAFVVAARLIDFSIPTAGSSSHIGGGLLLATLPGPQTAFSVTASVLTVQALGANLFNLGVLP